MAAAKQKRTSAPKIEEMTREEEKAVAQAYRDLKDGRFRTFKNVDEYLRYLDTVH